MNTDELCRRLADINAELARLTGAMKRLEGERDKLLLKLADSAGLHDRHVNAVR